MFFFFSSRRRHTRSTRDWSSDVCSSDLGETVVEELGVGDIANTIGSNFRLGEIEAAIAVEQLKKLDGLLAHRRHLAGRLTARLSELPGVVSAPVAGGCSHSYYVYPVRL